MGEHNHGIDLTNTISIVILLFSANTGIRKWCIHFKSGNKGGPEDKKPVTCQTNAIWQTGRERERETMINKSNSIDSYQACIAASLAYVCIILIVCVDDIRVPIGSLNTAMSYFIVETSWLVTHMFADSYFSSLKYNTDPSPAFIRETIERKKQVNVCGVCTCMCMCVGE